MGYGYLMMGITMSVLTVMLTVKVTVLHRITPPTQPLLCVLEQTHDIILSVHAGYEPNDPICEHWPDLLCHRHLWTWTL